VGIGAQGEAGIVVTQYSGTVATTCENAGMELAANVNVDDEELGSFCRRHGIARLSVFGSALRGELGPDSDVDLLAEFSPGRIPGLLRIAALERELSELIGRDVDLRTFGDLSPRFRRRVREEARQLYAAA
jgi:predicted nucleotidyltransferase